MGINELDSKNDLFCIFPNPAQSVINLKADITLLDSDYVIHDITGKIMLKGKRTSEVTIIELGNLSGGLYLLSVGANLKQAHIVLNK